MADELNRFDYVRLRYSTDHDLAQQVKLELDQVLELYTAHVSGEVGGHEYRVFPGGERGTSQYCLEVWGKMAGFVEFLDFEQWADRIMRIDVRRELHTAREDGIQELGERLRRSSKGGRNIMQYNSRPREKSRGRNAGGVGLAVGSHKSNWRASIYKRRGECAALEFQYSGEAVQRAVATQFARMSIPEVEKDPWAALRRHLAVEGLNKLERIADMDYGMLLEVASGRGSGLVPERAEQLEMGILGDYLALPIERRQSLLARLKSWE